MLALWQAPCHRPCKAAREGVLPGNEEGEEGRGGGEEQEEEEEDPPVPRYILGRGINRLGT